MEKKTAEQILSTPDFKTSEVEVPQWNAVVKVRSLSVKGRVAVGQGSLKDKKVDEAMFNVLTLVHGCVDPRFMEDHVQRMLDKDAVAVDMLAARIWELSRPDAETIKNV